MFKIVDVVSGVGVGSVGFWTKESRGEEAYEVGSMVVPGVPGTQHRCGGDRAGD